MFKLIQGPADWEQHRKEVALSLNITGQLVTWGKGPQSYPCLVASLQTGPLRINTAYVYPQDARVLLNAVAALESSEAIPLEAGGDAFGQQAVKQAAPAIPPSMQQQFNVHVTAQLLAMTYYIVESGLCTKEAFEQKLAQFTAQVDQWHTEDIEAKLREEQNRLGG